MIMRMIMKNLSNEHLRLTNVCIMFLFIDFTCNNCSKDASLKVCCRGVRLNFRIRVS